MKIDSEELKAWLTKEENDWGEDEYSSYNAFTECLKKLKELENDKVS